MIAPCSPDERRLRCLADQTALAIERLKLVERVDQARCALSNKLRVAMLTSLSHDLRTPLASILGAATTLIAGRNSMTRDGRTARPIREEAERPRRFVGNLWDMSARSGSLGRQAGSYRCD